jgi:hypothetical protein
MLVRKEGRHDIIISIWKSAILGIASLQQHPDYQATEMKFKNVIIQSSIVCYNTRFGKEGTPLDDNLVRDTRRHKTLDSYRTVIDESFSFARFENLGTNTFRRVKAALLEGYLYAVRKKPRALDVSRRPKSTKVSRRMAKIRETEIPG